MWIQVRDEWQGEEGCGERGPREAAGPRPASGETSLFNPHAQCNVTILCKLRHRYNVHKKRDFLFRIPAKYFRKTLWEMYSFCRLKKHKTFQWNPRDPVCHEYSPEHKVNNRNFWIAGWVERRRGGWASRGGGGGRGKEYSWAPGACRLLRKERKNIFMVWKHFLRLPINLNISNVHKCYHQVVVTIDEEAGVSPPRVSPPR